MSPAADTELRQRALTPDESFIVQAPAGSGKTGLLVQRLLKLLASVDEPEEIIAITFTRKAAAEMRERLLTSLVGARQPCPAGEFESMTWQLARDVVARDGELGWPG